MNQVPNASFAVKVKVRRWSKAVRIGLADCPYCHRFDVCISRPKSLLEEVAILALLRPVRCRDAATVSVASIARSSLLLRSVLVQSWKSKSQFNKRGRARMASNAQPSGDLSGKLGARASSGNARVSAESVERTQP
jgi:hypothetical protein